MNIITTRAERRKLERESAKRPLHLEGVPRSEWPESITSHRQAPHAIWRSRHFLVQFFPELAPAIGRLSILRTSLDGGRWADNIPWDDLQRLKREAGFGDCWAVEVYPDDAEVVNVANIRHLWLLPEAPAFAWRKKP